MTEEMKKELLDLAKGKGLDIAEESLQDLAELALEIVGVVVKHSANNYDDMIYAALKGKAQEVLSSLIDKIDGQEG